MDLARPRMIKQPTNEQSSSPTPAEDNQRIYKFQPCPTRISARTRCGRASAVHENNPTSFASLVLTPSPLPHRSSPHLDLLSSAELAHTDTHRRPPSYKLSASSTR